MELTQYLHYRRAARGKQQFCIDTYQSKKIIISGSSSLDLKRGKADLSRRFAYYDLKGLSFRGRRIRLFAKGNERNRKGILRRHCGYVAADGLEIGFGNKIPLYLFGFLY